MNWFIMLKYLKFIYSEKATKFCEIFTLLLTGTTQDKSKVKISQNFVAFSEYMNFTSCCTELETKTSYCSCSKTEQIVDFKANFLWKTDGLIRLFPHPRFFIPLCIVNQFKVFNNEIPKYTLLSNFHCIWHWNFFTTGPPHQGFWCFFGHEIPEFNLPF